MHRANALRSAEPRRLDRAFIFGSIVAAIGFAVSLSWPLSRDLYFGAPPSVPVSTIAASCLAEIENTECGTAVIALNSGRFYVSTTVPASTLTVTVGDASAITRSRFLLVRTGAPGRLAVETGGASDVVGSDLEARDRTLVPLPERTSGWSRITFTPMLVGQPFVVEELGFFQDQTGLLQPSKDLVSRIPGIRSYGVYASAATLAVCGFLVFLVWLAPAAVPRWAGSMLAAVLCLSICILELGTTYSPYESRDLRSIYATELVHSGSTGNLTGPLYEGSRLVQGLGQTFPPGIVPWHRMPGYGLFCALAAILGRTTDVIDIAMVVIVLQAIAYSVAVGVFVYAAHRVFRPWMAWLLGVLMALLPKQLANTQADSIIAPISLLVLAALLVYLSQKEDDERATFRAFLLVNGAFALWFFMRNDVLPGWLAMALVLAYRRWRRLAVPLVLIAAIALPWALYKRSYRQELDLLPTNTGEVLFLSLCEVPGAFPYACTDVGYFDWATRISQSDPTSSRASWLAVTEVLRHWATYPVHFGLMVWSKFNRCMFVTCWPGVQAPLNWPYQLIRKAGGFVLLLTLIVVSMAVRHQRRRSFLLGWALFFNMPLFLVVYDSAGRFNAAGGVSLIATAIPLLFESGLRAQVARHPWRAAAVAACVGTLLVVGWRFEDWVLKNDSLHYWAPLLDPAQSTLRFDFP